MYSVTLQEASGKHFIRNPDIFYVTDDDQYGFHTG